MSTLNTTPLLKKEGIIAYILKADVVVLPTSVDMDVYTWLVRDQIRALDGEALRWSLYHIGRMIMKVQHSAR